MRVVLNKTFSKRAELILMRSWFLLQCSYEDKSLWTDKKELFDENWNWIENLFKVGKSVQLFSAWLRPNLAQFLLKQKTTHFDYYNKTLK